MLFDISRFDSYREDNRMEVKKAKGGLPNSLWETYSAFANGYGGVILLGIAENEDHTWRASGLGAEDRDKLLKNFWDTINDPGKVSINLLFDRDVETFDVGEHLIIAIHVPMARREQKPVYINNDLFGGTYRRNHEGDYHCTRLQVKAMLRDQDEETMDMKVLDDVPLSDLNWETILGYRNRHRTLRSGHPFERLSDEEYLRSIGAVAISGEDHQLHPTAAGLLMFGDEYNIVRQFPEYFLDYREMLDPTIRWTDRLQSSSGDWTGNVFDFYFRVYNKIIRDVKIPFRMEGGDRIDDTPVHKALREALANCLCNADFYGTCGVVIRKDQDQLVLENPGYIRTGKQQMLMGGRSDPRNKALMKMFNLINIGERAGSGVPNIFAVWSDEGWKEPVVEEQFNPDRTILTLSFSNKKTSIYSESNAELKVPKKDAEIKVPKKDAEIKVSKKTAENEQIILDSMQSGIWYRTSELEGLIPVQNRRLKIILGQMTDQGLLESTGSTKGKRYRKKQ